MNKLVLPLVAAVMTFVIAADNAHAGLFSRCCKRPSILNKCRKVCCPEPVCCVEPEPVCCVEPEPVCCPEPAPVVVCAEPEPTPVVVCPEPEPAPVVACCPEPAPVVVVCKPAPVVCCKPAPKKCCFLSRLRSFFCCR